MEPIHSHEYVSPKFTLSNGLELPAVGLGTYRIRNGEEIMKMVDYALNAGYRLFDTAAVYRNEGYLKAAFKELLPKYGLERDDIFVTTKLSPADLGYAELTERGVLTSLANLGLRSVDLYLIHFPATIKKDHCDPLHAVYRDESWRVLCEMYDRGDVRSIGVSNYTTMHLKYLMSSNHGHNPVVNQVELHPYYPQKELREFCNEHNIVVQAYASLGGTSAGNFSLIKDPVIMGIAKNHKVSCAQVLLKWALQKNVAVIPKSINLDRIQENITLNFQISDDEMAAIEKLGDNMVKYAWSSDNVL